MTRLRLVMYDKILDGAAIEIFENVGGGDSAVVVVDDGVRRVWTRRELAGVLKAWASMGLPSWIVSACPRLRVRRARCA